MIEKTRRFSVLAGGFSQGGDPDAEAIGVHKASNGIWYFNYALVAIPTPASGSRSPHPPRVRNGRFRIGCAVADKVATAPATAAAGTVTISDLVQRYHDEEEAMKCLSERTLYDQRSYGRN